MSTDEVNQFLESDTIINASELDMVGLTDAVKKFLNTDISIWSVEEWHGNFNVFKEAYELTLAQLQPPGDCKDIVAGWKVGLDGFTQKTYLKTLVTSNKDKTCAEKLQMLVRNRYDCWLRNFNCKINGFLVCDQFRYTNLSEDQTEHFVTFTEKFHQFIRPACGECKSGVLPSLFLADGIKMFSKLELDHIVDKHHLPKAILETYNSLSYHRNAPIIKSAKDIRKVINTHSVVRFLLSWDNIKLVHKSCHNKGKHKSNYDYEKFPLHYLLESN